MLPQVLFDRRTRVELLGRIHIFLFPFLFHSLVFQLPSLDLRACMVHPKLWATRRPEVQRVLTNLTSVHSVFFSQNCVLDLLFASTNTSCMYFVGILNHVLLERNIICNDFCAQTSPLNQQTLVSVFDYDEIVSNYALNRRHVLNRV